MTPIHSAAAAHKRNAHALRFLAIDAIDAAKSGHPGMPMGMADIAEVLWRGHLKHDPARPDWPDRDRFILSNGHGSMLHYALLHLSGYDLPIEEIKRFRQFGSKTPGHPEVGLTPGIETTTGPLGQGLANAVGMALAERLLARRFNRPGQAIVDHRTYVFMGDGCLMEGISHEACSLAGVLGLGKLVCFYDDNGISIDGRVEGWCRDDTRKRFEAYGWNVVGPIDGHDPVQIDAAIRTAHALDDRPNLIICRTTIGWGSPKMAGTHEVHGAPLGTDEATATRAALGWSHGPFEIPDDVRKAWDARRAGAARSADWRHRFEVYARAAPADAAEFERRMAGELPGDWALAARRMLETALEVQTPTATRKSSQQMLEVLVAQVPELVGGSADLTSSNLTAVRASVSWYAPHESRRRAQGTETAEHVPNYLSYGVREFAMAAMMNGLVLHGGFIAYGGTFLVFSDYSRNAIRMSALMRLPVVHVLTHDSIGLGEDGPTHQPVEHASALRLIPGLEVWRPCDGVETAVAWTLALERRQPRKSVAGTSGSAGVGGSNAGPSALLLSRQNLPRQVRDKTQAALARLGGYVLSEASGPLAAIVIATGSEVQIALDAQRRLASNGIAVRVVSMPCTQVFDRQSAAYRAGVLTPGVVRVAVEAGHPDFWRKYVGLEGAVIGLAHFGESAPAATLYAEFGITADAIVEAVRRACSNSSSTQMLETATCP